MTFDLQLFIVLLTAHLLADFALQTDGQAVSKHRPRVFIFHIAIVGAVAYVLLGDWGGWILPLAVMATHGAIDAIKAMASPRRVRAWPAFVADQLAHVSAIAALSFGFFQFSPWWRIEEWESPYLKLLTVAGGLIACTIGAGVVIKIWLPTILDRGSIAAPIPGGLPKAGRYIGYLERLLLFVFVMNGQFAAVGFLVAAKSIFRFNDTKAGDQERAEYILVGTLLSFTLGIILALGTQWLWKAV